MGHVDRYSLRGRARTLSTFMRKRENVWVIELGHRFIDEKSMTIGVVIRRPGIEKAAEKKAGGRRGPGNVVRLGYWMTGVVHVDESQPWHLNCGWSEFVGGEARRVIHPRRRGLGAGVMVIAVRIWSVHSAGRALDVDLSTLRNRPRTVATRVVRQRLCFWRRGRGVVEGG
jgi:hypothetical protein